MSYEERLSVWIDAAPVAMLVADAEGRILIVNRAACTMFGYTAESLHS